MVCGLMGVTVNQVARWSLRKPSQAQSCIRIGVQHVPAFSRFAFGSQASGQGLSLGQGFAREMLDPVR